MTIISWLLTNVAEPQQESPPARTRRRWLVAAVLVVGAALLAVSLTRRPGEAGFYWSTLALAAVWAGGAVLSGPLHRGTDRRGRPPVLLGVTTGLLTGALFVAGALVVRRIDVLAEPVAHVLAFANQGALPLVVLITLVNGLAEELFFRGALYTALDRTRPVLVSTVLYAIVTSASGNPMLGFAAVVLGAVCALQRRATGGVLAPVLTHLVWGATMVLGLPPLFGL